MLDKLDMLEVRIRERAFALWEAAGSPEDRADEYWHRAREIEMREYDLTEGDLKRVAEEQPLAQDKADFA